MKPIRKHEVFTFEGWWYVQLDEGVSLCMNTEDAAKRFVQLLADAAIGAAVRKAPGVSFPVASWRYYAETLRAAGFHVAADIVEAIADTLDAEKEAPNADQANPAG